MPRRRGAERGCDLVEVVVGVGVGESVLGEKRLVSDVVVGVGEPVRADLRGDDFAAAVVGKG